MTGRKPLKHLYLVPVAVATLVLGLETAALAHAGLTDSSPAAGTAVTKPPKEVTALLAEPADQASRLVITDGCGREVSGTPDIRRGLVETPIAGGEPGRWSVRLRSVSAVDGHVIEEAFAFRVLGKKGCAAEDDISPDADISPDTSSRAPIVNPDQDSSSLPVIPIALGAVAVGAVALAVWRPWDRP